MTAIAERVAAGAQFLDEMDPGWWRADAERAIDLDRLDLGSGSHCILGQRCPVETWAAWEASGSYGTPYTAWGTSLSGEKTGDWNAVDGWAARLGFQVSAERDAEGNFDDFDDLTDEWKRLIEARRAS